MNPFSTYRPLKRTWDGSLVENTDNNSSNATSRGDLEKEEVRADAWNEEVDEEEEEGNFFDDLEAGFVLTSTLDVAKKLKAEMYEIEAAEAFASKGPDVTKGVYALSSLRAYPLDIVPKYALEVEANFNLRLMVTSMTSSLNSTFESTTDAEEMLVQESLKEWDRVNKYFTFPAINDPSNKPGWLSHSNADIRTKLGTNSLWLMPPAQDQDLLSLFKRNRLKWTEAMQSCWTQVQEGKTEYFYLYGHVDQGVGVGVAGVGVGGAMEDGDNSSSSRKGGLTYGGSSATPPMAAVVLSVEYLRKIWRAGTPSALRKVRRSWRTGQDTSQEGEEEGKEEGKEEDDVLSENGEPQEVCVMMGVSKSIVTRLVNFGIDLQIITRQGHQLSQQTNSRYNPVSSFGLRENALEGHSILLKGRRSVAHALDCLGESMHAFLGSTGGVGLASTSRTPAELPRIVAKQSFLHATEARLELGRSVQCKADFTTATARTKGASHRVQLVGDVLPGDMEALSSLLVAMARFYKARVQKAKNGEDQKSIEIDRQNEGKLLLPLQAGGLPVPAEYQDAFSRRKAASLERGKKFSSSTSTNSSSSSNSTSIGSSMGGEKALGSLVNPRHPHLKSAFRIGNGERVDLAPPREEEGARGENKSTAAGTNQSTEDLFRDRERKRKEGLGDDRASTLLTRLHSRYLAWLDSPSTDASSHEHLLETEIEEEAVANLFAFTVSASSSTRLDRAPCAALASSVPSTNISGGRTKVRVGNAEESLWRGQKRLLELFFFETPSTSLLAGMKEGEGGVPTKRQNRDGVTVEVTYSPPPAVELHPSSVLQAVKAQKQDILRLGPMKTY